MQKEYSVDFLKQNPITLANPSFKYANEMDPGIIKSRRYLLTNFKLSLHDAKYMGKFKARKYNSSICLSARPLVLVFPSST